MQSEEKTAPRRADQCTIVARCQDCQWERTFVWKAHQHGDHLAHARDQAERHSQMSGPEEHRTKVQTIECFDARGIETEERLAQKGELKEKVSLLLSDPALRRREFQRVMEWRPVLTPLGLGWKDPNDGTNKHLAPVLEEEIDAYWKQREDLAHQLMNSQECRDAGNQPCDQPEHHDQITQALRYLEYCRYSDLEKDQSNRIKTRAENLGPPGLISNGAMITAALMVNVETVRIRRSRTPELNPHLYIQEPKTCRNSRRNQGERCRTLIPAGGWRLLCDECRNLKSRTTGAERRYQERNMDHIQRAGELREEILRRDHLYLDVSMPELPDPRYDELMIELQRLETEHTECREKHSPTERIGGLISSDFQGFTHTLPMLGLGRTSSFEGLEEWNRRIIDLAGFMRLKMCAEIKTAGLAVSILYQEGELVRAATRGDGITGGNLTHNILAVRDLPLRIILPEEVNLPQYLSLEGQIYMPKDTFMKINQERKERGEQPYSNPRSAADGEIRQDDPRITSERNLRAWVHHCSNFFTGSQIGNLQFLRELGLPINPASRTCKTLQEVQDFYQEMLEQREGWEYEAQGIVVKVDDRDTQDMTGDTGTEPRWAVAWEFPAPK